MCPSRGGSRGQLKIWLLLKGWYRIKTSWENGTQPPIPLGLKWGQGEKASDVPDSRYSLVGDRWTSRLYSSPVPISSFRTQLHSQGLYKGTWWLRTKYLCHPLVAVLTLRLTVFRIASKYYWVGEGLHFIDWWAAIAYFSHQCDRISDKKKLKEGTLVCFWQLVTWEEWISKEELPLLGWPWTCLLGHFQRGLTEEARLTLISATTPWAGVMEGMYVEHTGIQFSLFPDCRGSVTSYLLGYFWSWCVSTPTVSQTKTESGFYFWLYHGRKITVVRPDLAVAAKVSRGLWEKWFDLGEVTRGDASW